MSDKQNVLLFLWAGKPDKNKRAYLYNIYKHGLTFLHFVLKVSLISTFYEMTP